MPKEPQNTEQLRAQAAFILSQALAQSNDIERALSATSGSGALHSRLAAAAARISGAIEHLSQALGSASFPLRAADLMALDNAVTSAEVSSLVAEATAAGATSARAVAVATASASTRQEVKDLEKDMFDKHIFNPYLHFSSTEDEAAFRKREADTRKYVDEQLALNTPDGNLRAAEALERAMHDAGRHGATASPEYTPRLSRLNEKITSLRSAIHTEEQAQHAVPTKTTKEHSAAADIDFAAMDAKLDAAGLRAPSDIQTTGHGLSVQKPQGRSGATITD